MNRIEAIKLLEEAINRIKIPMGNFYGADMQVGGAYWRLLRVANDFLLPQLIESEGAMHAQYLIREHNKINGEPEKEIKTKEIERTQQGFEQKNDLIISLGGKQYLPFNEVSRRTTMSRTFIYKNKDFPKPKKIGRRSFWDAEEVEKFLQTQLHQIGA